jgi:hypothetical protein
MRLGTQKFRRWIKPVVVRATQRIYLRKLLAGLQTIATEPLDQLRNVDRIEEIVARIGLAHDGRGLYGRNTRHMNLFGPGLWQIPRQLAEALCLLSTLGLRTALEIGTYQGWTASVLAAYLWRFEKNFQLTTIDPVDHFAAYRLLRERLPIEYLVGQTAENVAGRPFDLCLIDGDHAYASCARDYELCGQFARVCMFHDINDQFVGSENVPRFWRELKNAEGDAATFREFNHHSEGASVMGIGVRIREARNS